MMNTNKAQISLFFLFGVIIFIAFSFFSFLNSQELETGEVEEAVEISIRLQPLKNFVDNYIDFNNK